MWWSSSSSWWWWWVANGGGGGGAIVPGGGIARQPVVDAMRRALCLAVIAFSLGLAVGLSLPSLVLPPHHETNRNHQASLLTYPSVSFVNSTSLPTSSAVQGVYWSDAVEAALPEGYDETDASCWERFVAGSPVISIEEGCGRMQNRLVTFEGGVKACARYRQNTDQIQGELYSFYLGRELGLTNLAPSAPATVGSHLWSAVSSQISLAGWSRGGPVVLTKFIENLEPALIPSPLRNSSRRLHPPDVVSLGPRKATELAQWSDLIVFDYLTANLDRVVNNLYNLQWNPGMMEAPAHNLAKHSSSQLLLFLDNESGLLHGYRLLDKYESYHSLLLDALCIFRKSTVDGIEKLRKSSSDLAAVLNKRLWQSSSNSVIPGLPDKSIRILKERLERVLHQVSWCSKQYPDR